MELQARLAKIQSELKAPKSQYNNFGNYAYRNAEDILEAVKPLLGECVLTVSDELVHFPVGGEVQVVTLIDSKGNKYTEIINQDRFYVKATAKLSCGTENFKTVAYAREEESKKGMDGSQITGSASSYARKYALNGLFLIDDTKDSDSTNMGEDKKASVKTEASSQKPKYENKPKASEKQVGMINALITKTGTDRDVVKEFYKVESLKDLDIEQASTLIEKLLKKQENITSK